MRKDWIRHKNVIPEFLTFLDKISPLKNTNKLGTIIIQVTAKLHNQGV